MDEYLWRTKWIETLVQAGADMESAMDALDIFYGDDPIDTSVDPVIAAKEFLQQDNT